MCNAASTNACHRAPNRFGVHPSIIPLYHSHSTSKNCWITSNWACRTILLTLEGIVSSTTRDGIVIVSEAISIPSLSIPSAPPRHIERLLLIHHWRWPELWQGLRAGVGVVRGSWWMAKWAEVKDSSCRPWDYIGCHPWRPKLIHGFFTQRLSFMRSRWEWVVLRRLWVNCAQNRQVRKQAP